MQIQIGKNKLALPKRTIPVCDVSGEVQEKEGTEYDVSWILRMMKIRWSLWSRFTFRAIRTVMLPESTGDNILSALSCVKFLRAYVTGITTVPSSLSRKWILTGLSPTGSPSNTDRRDM
jgi:hypothetical protein